MNKGSVFLIPTYLSSTNDASFLAPMVLDVIQNCTHFLVENVRTSRRFISSLNLGIDISTLNFELITKNSNLSEIEKALAPVNEGRDVGIISEAGLPGLADPGALAVSSAHRQGVRVIPLPGASSIQSALISSGFNGQQFSFNGYLPIQKNERIEAIKKLELDLRKTGFTQVFMETPYRNMQLIEDLLKTLSPSVPLHISADLFGEKEMIKTKQVREWLNGKIDLHKLPAIFCIGQFP